MDHVVVLVECCAKDPKVVFVGKPVDNANLIIFVFNFYVNHHVLARELDPVALYHYKNVIWSSAAASVENSPALSVSNSLEQQFKESCLVA